METIESLYDAGSSDLRELLWDSCLVEPTLSHDWMMSGKDDEWVNGMTVRDIASLGVVLRDRLMTDAAFGGPRPVKSEHSYSLAAYSSPASPALAGTPAQSRHCEATPMVSDSETRIRSTDNGRPLSLVTKINDMEAECFPAISMNKASSRGQSSSPPPPPPPPPPLPAPSLAPLDFRIMAANVATVIEPEQEILEIKDEPIPSPESNFEGDRYNFNRNIAPQLPTHALLLPNSKQTSDSDEEEDYYQNLMEMEESETQHSVGNDEPALQTLPPTPPSSASSDSESAASASCSPERRNFIGTPHMPNLRGFLAPRLYVTNGTTHGHSTRQPIHTSLISCQPKGSTGTLVLTEEEKRTLIAEGYSVPTKLPLTKQEEKSLKKVRRKIKNKISAQESRRKKKEYMDGLERRVSMLTSENSSYRERLSVLEDTNCGLLKELERLKALIQR